MCIVNLFSDLIVIAFSFVHVINAQDAVREDWALNGIVNDIFSDVINNPNEPKNNKPLSNALSELTKKSSGEFDKMCHQLETVLKQLTFNEPVQVTQLSPTAVNKDCKCFCICPQNTINTKVIDDMKAKVMDLKKRFINVGRSIKEKIHELTAG